MNDGDVSSKDRVWNYYGSGSDRVCVHADYILFCIENMGTERSIMSNRGFNADKCQLYLNSCSETLLSKRMERVPSIHTTTFKPLYKPSCFSSGDYMQT